MIEVYSEQWSDKAGASLADQLGGELGGEFREHRLSVAPPVGGVGRGVELGHELRRDLQLARVQQLCWNAAADVLKAPGGAAGNRLACRAWTASTLSLTRKRCRC